MKKYQKENVASLLFTAMLVAYIIVKGVYEALAFVTMMYVVTLLWENLQERE